MNQKGMQEQNDISIIGKLPKRLQQKIAENCYGKTSTGNSFRDQLAQTEEEEEITTLVPGILRLNVVDTARQTIEVVALSPARQLPKSSNALPNWCKLPTAPAILKELPMLHAQLIDYINRDALLKQWRQFKEVRKELQQLFANLLLQHLKFCCEQKVDTFFWKLLFYNVREQLKQQKPLELVQQYLLDLCEDGLQFYQKLYEKLEVKYLLHGTVRHKYEIIGKVMAQKLLISLGDLSRYRAKQIQCLDMKEATAYYLRAQQLIPSNGIPYNQLAIVAIQSRKKFDAVYFHMRSLMSSNSIGSARESLLVLFDEIRKKYEENENKKSPIQRNYLKSNRMHAKDKSQQHDCAKSALRKEIWVHPETTCANLHRNDFRYNEGIDCFKLLQKQQNKYDAIHDDELSRHFINLYLYVLGKLYSGIGMDNLLDQQNKLCAKLNSLLQRQSFLDTFGCKRLLKILTLNIFIVEVNKNQETRRYQAYLFANQIFGLILQQCNKLLNSKPLVEDNELFEQNFSHLSFFLQYIHLYTKWLIKRVDIWTPLRKHDYDYNCWQELHSLFEHIRHLVALKNGQIEAFTHVDIKLEEEIFAAGFTPLCEQKERATVNASEQKKSACKLSNFYMRLLRISKFKTAVEENQALLQLERLPHEREIEEFKYILQTSNKLVNVQHGFKKSKSAQELSIGNRTEQKITTKDDNYKLQTDEAQMEVLQLSKLKRELEAKTNVKRLYKAKLEEIMNDVDTKLYIEVRPRYLLPDTNCFIDSIDDIEKLLEQFKCYTLMIPLTVVKELDGLAKGIKVEAYQTALPKDRIHHYDDVSTRAKRSLEFIKNAKNQVKCASTKGSIINASLFALVEEEYVSNDDKILATALALSKNFSVETSAGSRCFIQTELVLITTDRNLRVKALSRKLAVSDLTAFLDWTNDKVK